MGFDTFYWVLLIGFHPDSMIFSIYLTLMSNPVSQLYILVMCISQAGLEGYWGYHSQADTFGRRLPAFNIGLTRQPHEILGLTITKLHNNEPRILPFNRARYNHTHNMHEKGRNNR